MQIAEQQRDQNQSSGMDREFGRAHPGEQGGRRHGYMESPGPGWTLESGVFIVKSLCREHIRRSSGRDCRFWTDYGQSVNVPD